MNPKTSETKEIAPTMDGVEDYCWISSAEILMGKGSIIYKMKETESWPPFWDLTKNFGIEGNVSRMGVSPDGTKLVVVVGK